MLPYVYRCVLVLSSKLGITHFCVFRAKTTPQESAGKTLEEMDFLFSKGRTPFTFLDRDATKIGALFDREMSRGEALTAFDDDALAEKPTVEVIPAAGHTSPA